MKYDVISTGSDGNAVVLNNVILVDCGVSFKALQNVYKALKIVLLTHAHGDHFNAITIKRLAMERPTLRFGCCRWLVAALVNAGVDKRNIDVYEIGKIYDYGAFKVSPLKLYHDVENCGFRLFFGAERALYATDTAHLQGLSAKDYDRYLIEASYEDAELQERIKAKQSAGEYCYELNVANRHLSKEQADEFLYNNMGGNSEYFYLHGHKEKAEDIFVSDADLPWN
ncbi:MAG: MBL fold metallo-hydrolase [Clostridia bacterium]|nr:MBL fold metallo-hydrolase [Clostridia bacterium]